MNSHYPIVILPPLIKDFRKSQQSYTPKFLAPSAPLQLTRYWRRGIIIGSIGLGLLLSVFRYLSLGQILAIGLALTILILGIYYLWQYTSEIEQTERKEYAQSLRQWEKTQALLLRANQRRQRQGSSQRVKALKKLLDGKVLQPSGISTAQKGVSEERFLDRLKVYFKALENISLSFGGQFPLPGSVFSYSIDLALRDRTTGLSIDIEIDEPYEGKTKQPHHCSDDERDSNRDRFFSEGNWVVIRFAEEQVVRYPTACCDFIARSISQITGLAMNEIDLPKKVPPIARWTTFQARQMASRQLRENYLEEMGVFHQSKTQKLRTRSKKKKKS